MSMSSDRASTSASSSSHQPLRESGSESMEDDDYYPPSIEVEEPEAEVASLTSSQQERLLLLESELDTTTRMEENEAPQPPPTLPQAREHSYLPGASHPLCSDRASYRRSSSVLTKTNGEKRLFELAILELDGVVLFPGSTLPLRFTDGSLQGTRHTWLRQYLGRRIDQSRSGTADTESNQVMLGVLTRPDHRESAVVTQRRSWTRRSLGPIRLRRLSQQFLQQLAEWEALEEGDEDDDEVAPMIEESDNDEPVGGAMVVVPSEDGRRGPVHQPRFSLRRARSSASSTSSASSRRRSSSEQGWIGRIGTIATVTYTHGDDLLDRSDGTATGRTAQVWRNHDEGDLVVTALGTGRFRVVQDNSTDSDSRTGIRTVLVEELDDTPLSLPPLSLRNSLQSSSPNSQQSEESHQQSLQALSVVTPHPLFLCQLAWPWRLVTEIREALQRVSSFVGLWQSLSALEDEEKLKLNEPVDFSFWMAANMALTQKEKLKLLEMTSCLERLRFLRKKIAAEEEAESAIHCKVCGIPLARASAMFSVEGAEGTTGAYVNEYGCVHQTITLRNVDEMQVTLTGPAETRDSWFPGYSWTIAYCSNCDSHLGWKFQQVPSPGATNDSDTTSRDRPAQFYGLAAASVATHVAYDPSTSRRRRHS